MNQETTAIQDGYSIISHGGIGDELGEDSDRERPKHNLSGSCHELRMIFREKILLRVLMDMGAYQGRGVLERIVEEISKGVGAIVLTHPHMDHIGDLPRIFANNNTFSGRIISTPGTKQAAEIALIDSARLLSRIYEEKMEQYAKMLEEVAIATFTLNSQRKKGKTLKRARNGDRLAPSSGKTKILTREEAEAVLEKYGLSIENFRNELEKRRPEKPPYTLDDVYRTLSHIETHKVNDGWMELVPGQVDFKFYNAGHIIGSVSVLFRIRIEGYKTKYVLFSGDLGSYKWDIHPTGIPTPPHNTPIDTVVIESTYGNKVRPDFEAGYREFRETLVRDLAKYKQITMASFALDRAQNILYRLVDLKRKGVIDAEIFLDSPMATKHTEAYIKQARQVDDTIKAPKIPAIKNILGSGFEEKQRQLLSDFANNLDPKNGYYSILTPDNRISLLSSTTKPRIIVTASGMAEGGMILQYLKEGLSDQNKVFYFTGYLVPGTLGYAIANENQAGGQQKRVKIDGDWHEVRARVRQFQFLSGHGDAEDLYTWVNSLALTPQSTIRVVHGDKNGSSLEYKHFLERKGMTGVIVPGIFEENFFPFESISETPKKWAPKREKIGEFLANGPGDLEPFVPPELPKKRRKKPSIIVPTEAEKTATPEEVEIDNPPTGLRRYYSLIETARTEYDGILGMIQGLSIPFLEDVKIYLSLKGQIHDIETELYTQGERLRTLGNKLATQSSSEDTDAEEIDTTLQSLSKVQKERTRLFDEKKLLEKKGGDMNLPEELRIHDLSKGIIESLGLGNETIIPLPELTFVSSMEEIEDILIKTLFLVLEHLKEDTMSIYALEKASKIDSNEILLHNGNIDIIEKIATYPTGYYLQIISSLYEKVDAEYRLPQYEKKKEPRSREDGNKNIENGKWGENTPAGVTEIKITKEERRANMEALKKELETYLQYHQEKNVTLKRNLLRINQLLVLPSDGQIRPRGNFSKMTNPELLSRKEDLEKELSMTEGTLSNPIGLIDNATEYDELKKRLGKSKIRS